MGGTLTVHALPAIDHDLLADADPDAVVIAAVIDIESWLSTGGLALLAAIVFAETGLLVGFFLPGDSLLFMAGFLASEAGGHVLPPLPITAAVAFIAAVVGDQVGYLIGLRIGPSLFSRPGSRLFNPLNAVRAQAFFDRRGPSALVLARFVPIVRTFVPVIAGVGRMRYRTFLTYNIVGAAIWGIGVTTLGYFLGEIEIVKHNLELAAVVIVAISLIPIAVEYFRSRRESAAHAEQRRRDRPRTSMTAAADAALGDTARRNRRLGLTAGVVVALVAVVLLSLDTAGPLTPLKAIILGAVEGFTEYLPVSSTGHLLVVQRLLDLGDGDGKLAADTYAIAIQIGAILAVVVLYWRRLGQLASGAVGRDTDGRRLLIRLLIAFVPAAAVGVVAGDTIKDQLFGPWPIVAAWFVGGAFLVWWDPRPRDSGSRRSPSATPRSSVPRRSSPSGRASAAASSPSLPRWRSAPRWRRPSSSASCSASAP